MRSIRTRAFKKKIARNDIPRKVFGGGNVIPNSTMIGSRNAVFIRDFLQREKLRLVAEDLEGKHPRRVHYYPSTGKAMIRLLQRADDRRVVDEERIFADTLKHSAIEGKVELF